MVGSKFVKFLMSVLKWQVNSFLNFASFFIVITFNSSVNFKLIYFLFWIKGFHKSPNFETFEWSGENLPNSSCHFTNHKSFFLQILHNSSVSWKITPPYFLGQTLYICTKGHIKVQIFETWVLGSKFTKFLKQKIGFS